MSKVLQKLKRERKQVLEHAKKFILKKDKGFRKNEKHTAKAKPIRHPNGKTYRGADYAWWWSDAIWCGDIHLENLLLYMGIPDDGDKSVDFMDQNDDAIGYYTDLWNEALKEALPQVYWCVLSCELDDEPKTPQEEIWFKIACGEIDPDGKTDKDYANERAKAGR